MAGILDDVLDGIAAKEKQGGPPPPPTTPQTPATTPEHLQTPTVTSEEKPLHTYSDDFKNKYGGRK